MNSETRNCQNCKRDFVIEPEDFLFYEKISVPPPTWCSECRMVRRFLFRGWRKLYKRKVEGYDGYVFSKYSPDTDYTIYHEDYYNSDSWDAAEYAREYDFSRPFLEQFEDLFRAVPKAHRDTTGEMTGSEYCDNAGSLKNCYLAFNAGFSENCLYGTDVNNSRDCVDAVRVKNCELCYDIFDAESCHRVNFSSECVQCSDVWFSKNLINCHNCVGCVGLRNKQYYIFNKPYAKEEYLKEIEKLNLSSFKNVSQLRESAQKHHLLFPVRLMHGIQYVNSTGDYIYHSKNARNCFNVADIEDCAYCQHTLFSRATDSADITVAGGDLLYEGVVFLGSRMMFGFENFSKNWNKPGSNLSRTQYCARCTNSHNLFACVGIRNKQYCILNKQYTKEEYEALVPKIIEHMNTMPYISEIRSTKSEIRKIVYKYGEFFPPELSPFAYNETIAQEYFPLTKEQAYELGYRWKEPEEKEHTPTMNWRDLPDTITDVSDSILDEAILCSAWDEDAKKAQEHNCTKVFRIIPQELAFYRKMNLPLPRFCPNSRHFHRIQQRNPLRLWHRKCMCQGAQTYAESDTDVSAQTHADDTQNNAEIGLRESASGQRESALPYINTANHFHGAAQCSNEFKTSYAPERPEIVYCEQCYQSEVV